MEIPNCSYCLFPCDLSFVTPIKSTKVGYQLELFWQCPNCALKFSTNVESLHDFDHPRSI